MRTDVDDTRKRTLLLKVLATIAIIGAINRVAGRFRLGGPSRTGGPGARREVPTG